MGTPRHGVTRKRSPRQASVEERAMVLVVNLGWDVVGEPVVPGEDPGFEDSALSGLPTCSRVAVGAI